MTGVLVSFCLSTVSLFLHAPLLAAEGPVVSTHYGSLRGEYQTVKGTEMVVHSYLGVPFAKPPVGPLRLAPPQPAVDWQGIRDATLQPRMCLQDKSQLEKIIKNLSVDMDLPELSEDCLYLNIYTPGKLTADTKLPVMVWIHGGGLVLGGASLYDGSALSAYESVVVVVIQYRLGILGFFSTGDEHARGNFGLLDQVAALRWVQENIHSFGGDPKSVTIFGESAGGVSVSLQLLSPLSSGLFHRAIAESGTADMKIVFNPLPVAQIVANLSGCDISSSKGIVQCMMQTTEEEILNIYQRTKIPFFGVTVDGLFLTKSAEEVFQKKEFHKVPFLMGVTNDECGWAVINFFSPPGWEEGMDREQMTSLLSTLNPEPTGQQISEWITDEYLGTTKDRMEIRDRLTEAMGDLIFVIPTIRTAMFHRDAGVPVYLYEFQYGPSMFRKIRPSFVKSDHGDEVFFVFGTCFWDSHIKITAQFTEEENQLCRTMMAYWANFARTGSPNGAGLVPWQPFGQEQEYLGIGLEQKPGQRLKQNRFSFLTQTLPEKVRVLAEGKHREL